MSDDFLILYDVIGKIGEGGLCVILKIRDKTTGQIIALKKLKVDDSAGQNALKKEYQFLKSYQYPNIVKTYDFITEPQNSGFFMEYLDGASLQTKCGQLKESSLTSAIADILETAQFVYHCGFIYNDYKPQNFVYAVDGQLKLIDFNLLGEQHNPLKQQCGTLEYLSPEILTGGETSVSSDIYALGATLYELIAGRPPYSSTDQDALLKLITETSPPPLTGCDTKTNAAILAMLARNPSVRPANPYAAAVMLGLQKDMDRRIKEHASYYLDAGTPLLVDDTASGNPSDPIHKHIDKYLKRHSLSAQYIDNLSLYTGGYSQIIYQYLIGLIASDTIRYGDKGWQAFRPINDSDLPPGVRDRYLAQYSPLSQTSKAIIEWLAILDQPQAISILAALTQIPLNQLEIELRMLENIRWLIERRGVFGFVNRSQARSVYDNIPISRRQEMHKKTGDYLLKQIPLVVETIAFHYGLSNEIALAINYNYRAARTSFEKFDNQAAKKFIDMTLNGIALSGQGTVPSEQIIVAMLLAGDINKALADNTQSEKMYLKAAALANEFGDKESLALAYKNLGDLLRINQRSEESINHSQKALEFYKQQKDLPRQAACLNNIGLGMMNIGNYPQALDYFTQALFINEQIGDLNEQAKLHSNIGIINDITGNTVEVAPRFTKALECARAVGNVTMETTCLNNLGYFYLNFGNPQKALEYFSLAGELAQKAGHTDQQININLNAALAYNKMGNFIKSVETHQKTLGLAKKLGNDTFIAQASHLLARDCQAMGNYKLANQMLTQADQYNTSLSNNEFTINIRLARIELFLELGKIEDTRNLLDEVQEMPNLTSQQSIWARYLRARWLSMGNNLDAAKIYEEIIASHKQDDSPEIVARAIVELFRHKLQNHQLQSVADLLKRLAGLTIQNVLIELDCQLVSAEYSFKLNKFDEALSQIKIVKEKAEQSGCMPVLLMSYILEAEILGHCGKMTGMAKIAARAEKIYGALLAALPDSGGAVQFENLPLARHLKSLMAHKPQLVRQR
jgi:serine/threonine protein kinase/Tfp pilus assembly protein PilF